MNPDEMPNAADPVPQPPAGPQAERSTPRDWLESQLRTLSAQPRHRAPETFTASVMDRLQSKADRPAAANPAAPDRPFHGRLLSQRGRSATARWIGSASARMALWTAPAPSPAMAAAVLLPLMLLVALNISILGNALRVPSAVESPFAVQQPQDDGLSEETEQESSVWVSVPFPDVFTQFAETSESVGAPSGPGIP
jgi:hypothetical protein